LSVLIFCIIIRKTDISTITNYSLAWIWWYLVWFIICIFVFIYKYKDLIHWPKIVYDQKMNSEYIKYALWVLLWLNAWVLMWQIDQQMIISMIWPKYAWYYTNYLSLFNIRSILIWAFFTFLFPLISSLHASLQKEKIQSLQNIIYTYFTVFGIILSMLYVVLWENIAIVLFGQDFALSWKLLMVSGFFVIFTNFIDISFGILAWIGKIKQRVLILWIWAVLNIVINFFAIDIWWIWWAIFATIVSWIFISISSTILVYKNYPFVFGWGVFFKNIIWYLIFAIFLYYSKDYIFLSHLSRLQNLILLCIIWIISVLIVLVLNFKQFLIIKNILLENFFKKTNNNID